MPKQKQQRTAEEIVQQIRSQVTQADLDAFDELISGGIQGGAATVMKEGIMAKREASRPK